MNGSLPTGYLFDSGGEHHWVKVLEQEIRDLVDIIHALLLPDIHPLLFIGSLRNQCGYRRSSSRRSEDALYALGRFGRFQLQSVCIYVCIRIQICLCTVCMNVIYVLSKCIGDI